VQIHVVRLSLKEIQLHATNNNNDGVRVKIHVIYEEKRLKESHITQAREHHYFFTDAIYHKFYKLSLIKVAPFYKRSQDPRRRKRGLK
jgi:hypothetical protein